MEPITAIKILSFKNCELHCCHLDGYKSQREAFLKRLSDIEQYFASKPPDNRYRIWFNVDETTLDDLLLDEIAASIIRILGHIVKIAFIGLGRINKYKLDIKLSKATNELSNVTYKFGTLATLELLPRSYFSDAEKAKEWLVQIKK